MAKLTFTGSQFKPYWGGSGAGEIKPIPAALSKLSLTIRVKLCEPLPIMLVITDRYGRGLLAGASKDKVRRLCRRILNPN